jgi:hypothetical protein
MTWIVAGLDIGLALFAIAFTISVLNYRRRK